MATINNIRDMKIQDFSSSANLSWGNTINLHTTSDEKAAGGTTVIGDWMFNRDHAFNGTDDRDVSDQN